jgi:hypothetical protein
MHRLVLRAIKVGLQKTLFILVSYDKLTTIDNESWLLIHLYVIDEWKWVPIFLNLQKVLDGETFDNFSKLIVQRLVEFGSMTKKDVTNKLVCFKVDGMIVFQGLETSVTTKLM